MYCLNGSVVSAHFGILHGHWQATDSAGGNSLSLGGRLPDYSQQRAKAPHSLPTFAVGVMNIIARLRVRQYGTRFVLLRPIKERLEIKFRENRPYSLIQAESPNAENWPAVRLRPFTNQSSNGQSSIVGLPNQAIAPQ